MTLSPDGYELVPRLMTVAHAAELMDCSPDLIYDLIRCHRVEARVLPGHPRSTRVNVVSLMEAFKLAR